MSVRTRRWTPGTPCWADLLTPDPEAARSFYAAILGWEFEIGGDEYGGYTVCTRGGVAAAGVMKTMSPDQPVAWTLYFATADARATAAAVTAAGGQVHLGPMDVAARGSMIGFTDPAGVFTGAWQAAEFIGAGVVNEPGALIWEDARSPDPDATRAFLTTVFGISHDAVDGLPEGYTTMRLVDPNPIGGVGPQWEAPTPHWLVYFGVEDVDVAVAAVTAGGGTARPVDDTPFGRMTTVTDPFGATFAIMETGATPHPDRS